MIQNQQTIISPSNQHRPHHGTFGGGGIHQNAGNRFQTRPDQFQQHIPNNHLSIHQNQAVSQNFLRSQHNEEGVDSRYNFMSAAEFDQPDDNELVSTRVIFILYFHFQLHLKKNLFLQNINLQNKT